MKTDIYQQVTDRIIGQLESGTPPWVKPWNSSARDETWAMPFNMVSKKHYNGINLVLLSGADYSSNAWLTYKQARQLGGNVRKGEHGTQIIFWKVFDRESKTDPEKTEHIPMLRSYTVFNAEQCDELELPPLRVPVPVTFEQNHGVERFLRHTGAEIKHGGNRAYFSPELDYVQLPYREDFRSASDYYATALHELTHWTGHKSRLAREQSGFFGSGQYAEEELVAELGSAFLCAEHAIDGQLQHASYLDSWLAKLRKDKKFIFKASAQAQKAADYLRDIQPCEEQLAA